MACRPACAALALALLLAGCATWPDAAPPQDPVELPLLRLAPKALGCTLSAQQRIDVQAPGSAPRSADVLLEADAQGVSLALLAMGQTLARLHWDGQTLTQNRSAWAPEALAGERILSELQMAGWPLAAVQQALPAGWQMRALVDGRELRHAGALRLRVHYGSGGVWTLENPRQNYRLTIHTLSRSVQPPAQAAAAPACF